MKAFRLVATTLAAALLPAGAAACLDFTPVAPLGASADSGPAANDAQAEGATSGQANKCLDCAAGTADGGGCPSEFAACEALDACKKAATCATEQCLPHLATIGQCLPACESDAGVSDPSNPAYGPFSALLSCMSTHCQTACLQ